MTLKKSLFYNSVSDVSYASRQRLKGCVGLYSGFRCLKKLQSKFMSCKCHCDIYEYMNLIYKYLTSQKIKYPRVNQFTLKTLTNVILTSTELKVPDKDWSMLSGYGLVLIRSLHRRTHVKTMCTPGHVIIEIKVISKWNEEKVHYKNLSRFLVSKRNLLLRICIIYFI